MHRFIVPFLLSISFDIKIRKRLYIAAFVTPQKCVFLCVGCRSMTTLGLARGDKQSNGTLCASKGPRVYMKDGMIPFYTGFVPRSYP